MVPLTKQDVIIAFHQKQAKRNKMLYMYYKDILFDAGYTAAHIAKKIYEDLGIKIDPKTIYLINKEYVKKQKPVAPPPLPASSAQVQASSAGNSLHQPGSDKKEKVQKREWVFKNADEYPKKDPFNGALDDL